MRHASTSSGCRIRAHGTARSGLVLEAVLSGAEHPQLWQDVCELLREEIPRRSPHYLVFDLRDLECAAGSALLGGLVAGAIEMKNMGRLDRTRIVARGDLARRLAAILPLCRLEPLLGVVHPDLESALAAS